ncbi:MobA/MobL protein, partial [mine drainage metagenome]
MSVRVHSRSRGESATAGAAYRLGLCIMDARTGIRHDYRRRSDIAAALTVLPDDAPPALGEPAALWNAAEAAERRGNSCVAREVLVALPAELTDAQREALARELAAWLVARYSVAVSVGLHRPEHGANWHAHMLMTTRRITAQGFADKVRMLDDKITGPQEIEAIRAEVARATNAALERAAQSARIDHRSLEAQ